MDLTFVFPCLNEERSLAVCIEGVRKSLSQDPNLKYEIVVADNGSKDRSREIAVECGARLVPVSTRGYGAALKGGIEAALGEYVMFADADATYLYEDALPLYQATIKDKVDMGIASRMKGKIDDGAMPFLHRYLGTPVLTGLINILFGGKLSDCNSGFRCIRRQAFADWNVRSPGMEFASELLIKALKHKASCVEIPSGLRAAAPDRVPHLRTWRDGMRHLLFILSERPQLFEKLGLYVTVLATLMQIIACFTGPIKVLGLNIFDVHSQALLLLAGLVGAQFYVYGCMCYLRANDTPGGLTRALLNMDEGQLFFLLLGALTAIGVVIGGVVVVWAQSSFGGINLVHLLLALVHFLSLPILGSMGLLGLHILKRYERS
ncbi:glycosyltransferase family 2 protein [Roseimicrobium sp. ORNL1]|uniref:glycosyltransferase family 2 protein n=1 Tax=Roseimicrobium sp. ORNL1 TaxID=2711231 RepID=UPI0013E10D96|nr:glycosyltransferase family 2 protein [Roseimicrobium sp. ORNL1]QIF03914.1 glycosyltransferase family 2 protein [Roseimicrobium sp. ORNL1]